MKTFLTILCVSLSACLLWSFSRSFAPGKPQVINSVMEFTPTDHIYARRGDLQQVNTPNADEATEAVREWRSRLEGVGLGSTQNFQSFFIDRNTLLTALMADAQVEGIQIFLTGDFDTVQTDNKVKTNWIRRIRPYVTAVKPGTGAREVKLIAEPTLGCPGTNCVGISN